MRSSDFKVTYEPWVTESDPAKLYGTATGIHGTQRLVTCLECGLLYENPRYPAEVIVQGYMASDDPGHDSQYKMRVESFSGALRKLGANIPPGGSRVLDIGAAGGAFLDAAMQHGYDAWGLEPSSLSGLKGGERTCRSNKV